MDKPYNKKSTFIKKELQRPNLEALFLLYFTTKFGYFDLTIKHQNDIIMKRESA